MSKQAGDFLLLHFFWLLTFLLYPFTIQPLESVSPRLVTFLKDLLGWIWFFVFIAAPLRFINFSTEKFISKLKNQNLIPFAQPALQLGRQGTGDERDRNCALAGFTLQTLSNATRRAEEMAR